MSKLGMMDARRLLMQGQEALSCVEANGMRIDTAYVDRMMVETQNKLNEIEDKLRQDSVWAEWKKVYGAAANLDSPDQLGHIIFNVMGVPCEKFTETGKPATDEESLERVKFPFIQLLSTRNKLSTARNTFLVGIQRETVDGFLHPIFSLNTVTTYRSSGSYPNPQNWPNRIKRVSRLIRSAFIPRSEDHVLVEIDLSGAEVRVSACYHRDPTMIRYIHENYDYHKELAMQCYMLDVAQMAKPIRQAAKGGFVFASFYGDWYPSIAENLWNAITRDSLARSDGVSLHEHLKSKGIRELGGREKDPRPGTFKAHIRDIYEDFWGRRFSVYAGWKADWFNAYLENGFCQSHTGFIYRGINKRNEIINYPIQGSSFHCLLWSLIQLNNWLRAYSMQTKIIGQIHDSIILDVHRSELQDVLQKARQVMLYDIRDVWDWLVVPMEAEASISEVNWFEKREIPLGQAA